MTDEQVAEGSLASAVTVESELLDVIESVARQSCFCDGSMTDSGAISANAEALRALAKRGRFRITGESGRMVIGYWPEHEPPKATTPTTKETGDQPHA